MYAWRTAGSVNAGSVTGSSKSGASGGSGSRAVAVRSSSSSTYTSCCGSLPGAVLCTSSHSVSAEPSASSHVCRYVSRCRPALWCAECREPSCASAQSSRRIVSSGSSKEFRARPRRRARCSSGESDESGGSHAAVSYGTLKVSPGVAACHLVGAYRSPSAGRRVREPGKRMPERRAEHTRSSRRTPPRPELLLVKRYFRGRGEGTRPVARRPAHAGDSAPPWLRSSLVP